MEQHKIWIEQCEAAEDIEARFGTQRALDYLVGEKFINLLEAAEDNAEFRAEIPDFVAKIHEMFEQWQLGTISRSRTGVGTVRSRSLRRRRRNRP